MTSSSSRSSTEFEELRTDAELTAERARIDADRERVPDKTLAFESLMPLLYGDPDTTAARVDLPDAPRGDERGARHLPDVRDEAHPRRANGPVSVDLPDAPRRDEHGTRHLPEVRDEAHPRRATAERGLPDAPT